MEIERKLCEMIMLPGMVLEEGIDQRTIPAVEEIARPIYSRNCAIGSFRAELWRVFWL